MGGVPPSGTVTLLFADIEGSTRLWEAHPEAMRDASCSDCGSRGPGFEARQPDHKDQIRLDSGRAHGQP
jgi:hypothetical protein